MNLNTITEVKRPDFGRRNSGWREGYAWLAGGTWLFSTPQIATHTLIDLEIAALAGAQAHRRRTRDRGDLHHRRARTIPGAGQLDRRAAVEALLPRAV